MKKNFKLLSLILLTGIMLIPWSYEKMRAVRSKVQIWKTGDGAVRI